MSESSTTEAPSAGSTFGGDVNYEVHGRGYAAQRRTDPRIAALVEAALGDARTILNVGAGAGSYEPVDRHVIAIEPSATMRAQRPSHLSPAIHGFAEAIPLDDQSVDASMAMITVHQWSDLDRGLSELKRVTRGPIIILTFDGEALDRFWLADYAPDLLAAERPRYPNIERLAEAIGPRTAVERVKIPIDCVDGFTEAFYARPEKFLEETVRRSQSAWTFVKPEDLNRILSALRRDLDSGDWDKRYGELRAKPYFEGSLRLIVSPHR